MSRELLHGSHHRKKYEVNTYDAKLLHVSRQDSSGGGEACGTCI